jgi:8-oxo-dGTP pyrophosphatase MutT (NUDIX family)
MNTVVSAGVFFYAESTERYLYLLRSGISCNWALPGGKIDKEETLLEGIIRECEEEVGVFPDGAKLIPVQKFVNKNFTYHTFFCKISQEFTPILNDEHIGYAWVGDNQYPKPLHPGLFSTVNFDIVKTKLTALTR